MIKKLHSCVEQEYLYKHQHFVLSRNIFRTSVYVDPEDVTACEMVAFINKCMRAATHGLNNALNFNIIYWYYCTLGDVVADAVHPLTMRFLLLQVM